MVESAIESFSERFESNFERAENVQNKNEAVIDEKLEKVRDQLQAKFDKETLKV